MENLLLFFQKYGLAITLIAIAGIAILGILKYCNLFKKIEEGKRHYIYLAISIGFSVAATIIYLLIIKRFDWTYMLIVASAIYALNQTFYNIFKVTPVNELIGKLLDFIKKLLANAGNKPPDNGE